MNAITDHANGFNCAQAVLMQFAKDLGLSRIAASKIASCFGGGMRMGRTCGALTGALMVLGLGFGFSEADQLSKQKIEERTEEFTANFKIFNGSTECKDIIGMDVSKPKAREKAIRKGLFEKKCPLCIASSILLLEKYLESKG